MARQIKIKFFAFSLHLEGMDAIERAARSPEHADAMVALINGTAGVTRMEKDDVMNSIVQSPTRNVWVARDLSRMVAAVEAHGQKRRRTSQTYSALACDHVYHKECIDCYAAVKKVHIADLKCPTCTSTSHDIRARENADALVATEVAQNDRATPAEPLRREDAGDVDNASTVAIPVLDDRAAEPPDLALVSLRASDNSEDVAAMPNPVRSASVGFQIEAVPAWNTKDVRLICNDCGQICVNFRVLSKGNGSVRCNKCCYVHTRLYRSNGPGGWNN